MIMRNYSTKLKKHDQDRKKPNQDFTRILRAAKPHWEEFLSQPKDHIARGLVWTVNGRGHTADLCFDKRRKRIRLVIRLHLKNGLSSSQLQAISKVQNETEGLSSLVLDKENAIITINSLSVLPTSILADAVVPQVFQDALLLLGNDTLMDF